MKDNLQEVKARLASPIDIEAPTDARQIRNDVQWMPPGKHTIAPLVNGERTALTITVDDALAKKFSDAVVRLRADAANGKGDLPFIDFNHEDGAAAAEVLGLRWAGDHPTDGGIRADVKWSDDGRSAVAGRSFRRFSPQWLTDKASGDPVGVGVNLGGLVNRAAFTTIQPVAASAAGQAPMAEEIRAVIRDSLAPLETRISNIETKVAQLTTSPTGASASDADSDRLAKARSRIEELVRLGKFPPQDKQGQEVLAKALVADPAMESVLARLSTNPAFQRITGGCGTDAQKGPPVTFKDAVALAMDSGKVKKSDAITRAAAEHPALYAEWRKTGGNL